MTEKQCAVLTVITLFAFILASIVTYALTGEFITNGLILTPFIPFCIFAVQETAKDFKNM